MAEGMQITIPDFDDDDYTSTPIPFGRGGDNSSGTVFGRSAGAFGHGGFGSAGIAGPGLDSPRLNNVFGHGSGPSSSTPFSFGAGQDSPTTTTTGVDRTYFQSHNRGDSIASEDSGHSIGDRPFASKGTHTTSYSPSATAVTKKSSFASIRKAFNKSTSSKNAEVAPPVPPIDHQSYPVLMNPFNKSATSLLQSSRPQEMNGNPHSRAPTPTSGRPGSSKSTRPMHSYKPSQHSLSGSVHHMEIDQIVLPPFSSGSPPPVPRVPFGAHHHPAFSENATLVGDYDDDRVAIDLKTPSDYALHAVFIRFAASAESKIDTFLCFDLDREPLLPDFLGEGVDTKFDEFLQSLGKIAQKHTKPVVDSVMRWRKSQNEASMAEAVQHHIRLKARPRVADIPPLLIERKSLASIYIMCRALIEILKVIPKDALGEAMAYSLEETTFEQFRKPDLKLLQMSANHRTNAELYAKLLGLIANVRFVSVTDRFLGELGPVASGQVLKDDVKYENLVQGLRHVQIKVWPPETFEDGAEFLESLSKSFENAHGQRLKMAFTDTLLNLLHPIGKTAQAEVNHPQWAKAIEVIYPRAREMTTKPRYWQIAFPLAVTSLCVAPQQFFLKNWQAKFEAAAAKIKEKPHRVAVMNGMVRLVWTYLYRCQEPASVTFNKLEPYLKSFFPPNRLTVLANEGNLDPFVYIIHFLLSRHFEYGRDYCMELLQEATIKSASSTNFPVAPERTAIAIQAILLSLHLVEREEATPAWPSSVNFSEMPPKADYPTSSEYLPAAILSKPGMNDFFERCGTTMNAIATAAYNSIGTMNIFDEQWTHMRGNLPTEDALNNLLVVRRRKGLGTFAYAITCVNHINLLETCFNSWPRCLYNTLAMGDAVDMLINGVCHIEAAICDAASSALKRFMADPQHALVVIGRFTSFLFGPLQILQARGIGSRLMLETDILLGLWATLVDQWASDTLKRPRASITEEDVSLIDTRICQVEAAGLFLLSYTGHVHNIGVRIFRILGLMVDFIMTDRDKPALDGYERFVDLLHEKASEKRYLYGFDDLLDKAELVRLEQWRLSTKEKIPLRLADSADERDRALWPYIYPTFMQCSMDHRTQSLFPFREMLMAAVNRVHSLMAQLAGLSSKTRVSNTIDKENKALLDQWHSWVKILCATATLSESRPALTQVGREHARVPSDANFEKERLTTTRGLFRYLTPFLDSEHTHFRNVAVLCISSLPASAYPQLLEDLSLLAARQFYDESRYKPNQSMTEFPRPTFDGTRSSGAERSRRQERLHSAVARIYFLTAPFLKEQRSAGRQAVLANVLKFVRNTQAFLATPDARDSFTLQRLRRYFCGTVERLFDSLGALEGSDRFIPPNMQLSLYRMCEEWCQAGPQTDAVKKRLILMQRAVAAAASTQPETELVERFRHETILLSDAAVGALASLCQKAFFPSDMSLGSPIERNNAGSLAMPEVFSTLNRWCAVLGSSQLANQIRAKKALNALLSANNGDKSLLQEALRRALVAPKDVETSTGRFFEVIADIICKDPKNFEFSQAICLGLVNLCHPLQETRRLAFNVLETTHQHYSGVLSMAQYEPTIGSSAPGTFTLTHRLVSQFLATEHPERASDVLAQFSRWLPRVGADSPKAALLLLQGLECWISHIALMGEDKDGVSSQGHDALYHLITITLNFSDTHTEQIPALWARLVDSPHETNGHATVRFLLEQAHKVGSAPFITCAANIVACLSETVIGKQVVQDICTLIEPAQMLPAIDHRLNFPEASDLELWSNLDALFSDQPRLPLGSAQFALLFLADTALEHQWDMHAELPILLHSIFTHLDHRTVYVRQQACRMLFQLLRSWVPGYDELGSHNHQMCRSELKTIITSLETEMNSKLWKEDDTTLQSEPKIKWLCGRVIEILEPLAPSLTEHWGSVALRWGTSCSIRAIAFRSLQIFRGLMPRVTREDLALLLGRLSNTIAAPDENIQSFTSEIITTLNAVASSNILDLTLLPQMFWCACACLSTTVEKEFGQILKLLESLFKIIDLEDPDMTELIASCRPSDWIGSFSLQSSLMTGLRSATTSGATLKLLMVLAKVQDGRVIDPTGGRVRDLYTASLPWCLNAMSTDSQDEALQDFAMHIGQLALEEGRESISRIMTSFVKNRFRTKDDFLRQSVSSLREHYGSNNWTDVATLLLGLVLNNERWLRIQSMQILKVLFQQRETRTPVDLLGSELLMPLLRLLETDLATQALDVLEEPMKISGGPPAKHVLRMSMHVGKGEGPHLTDVFGIPEESGWCTPRGETVRSICRSNVMAVFDTCKMDMRPSRIDFQPEVEITPVERPEEDDLGDLVHNLHELTTYFQNDQPAPRSHVVPVPLPSLQLEARVAAILAKSNSSENLSDAPPTPFLDVFHVGPMPDSDDSDDISEPDSDGGDAFIFDNPQFVRPSPNGVRHH